ncbi:MAG: hypothetical protein HC906_17600 [Bacteroidales bacterium]|nr:hypothetical protein [Bacteroidales bacterium]
MNVERDYTTTRTDDINVRNISPRRISWGAIFAGALVMLVVMMLLSLLGIGIGAGTINPLSEQQPLEGLGTGTVVWWIISNLIAVLLAGMLPEGL